MRSAARRASRNERRRTRCIRLAAAVVGLCALGGGRGEACTTFCSKTADGVVFGRNYDFEIGDGALMVNLRGLQKQGMAERGPRWTSIYGSVTFNQFGREFPTGGMNENGLVVELMWLDEARYPDPDARDELGVLEWIQYQLDNAASVRQVLASDKVVRIAGKIPLHYLVSDASGDAAAVEFLDGRLQAHTGADLPVGVLANSTYEASLRAWRAHGTSTPRGGDSSEARFGRAATAVGELAGLSRAAAIERAFAILARVAESSTRWSIVYDQTARVVHFRTDRHRATRTLRLETQDFSCRLSGRLLDLAADLQGDVSERLAPYTAAANAALVTRSYAANSVTRQTPAAEVAAVVAHSEQATCGQP